MGDVFLEDLLPCLCDRTPKWRREKREGGEKGREEKEKGEAEKEKKGEEEKERRKRRRRTKSG